MHQAIPRGKCLVCKTRYGVDQEPSGPQLRELLPPGTFDHPDRAARQRNQLVKWGFLIFVSCMAALTAISFAFHANVGAGYNLRFVAMMGILVIILVDRMDLSAHQKTRSKDLRERRERRSASLADVEFDRQARHHRRAFDDERDHHDAQPGGAARGR